MLLRHDKVAIASKVYFNEGRLSKNAIMREIDDSLKLLGTDYLEEMYVPHPVLGAIDKNPPQGVMLLDEKK